MKEKGVKPRHFQTTRASSIMEERWTEITFTGFFFFSFRGFQRVNIVLRFMSMLWEWSLSHSSAFFFSRPPSDPLREKNMLEITAARIL
jgi:hypothetical protein